jgi:Na+-transporting methylmalonyl-CoA/oxaloacetate decarboxylase gamma subunit
VDFLVFFVFMIRMIGDGDGRAPADDVSGENKGPNEEKSTVVENTSAPVISVTVAAVTAHREEKKEQQATIKTLLPVVRPPSRAQEISATERLAFFSASLRFSFGL